MNIPGLDAPSWNRVGGGVDEISEAEEERLAERRWKAAQAQGTPAVMYTSSTASVAAPAAPLPCDVLVLACGMMSSAFLHSLLGGEGKGPAASTSQLHELGRFTLSGTSSAAVAPALAVGSSASKQAAADAKRPYALLLASLPNDASTLVALNYSRAGVAQFYELTKALFAQVAPKRVLLLDTLHHGSYVSALRPVPCPPLLRRLQSTAMAQVDSGSSAGAAAAAADAAALPIPELEAPNLVDSFGAAVLTHCEVHRLPAQLFVSMESRHYVQETLQAFEEALPALLAGSMGVSAPFRATATSFLGASASARAAAYRTAAARLQRVYAYSAGQDSSMRETAGEVQRDNMDSMFY